MVLFVILLLIAQPMFVIPSDAYVQRPSITLYNLTPSYLNIPLPLASSRKVQFATNISVSNPSAVNLEVTLSASVDDGWDINVTPVQMTFNASGRQKVVITVTVPGDITKSSEVQVRLESSGWYPNMTMPMETSVYSTIYLEQHHSYEVTYRFLKKDQYSNRIEFIVTNKGTGDESIMPQLMITSGSDSNIDVNFDNMYLHVSPNGPPGTIIMMVQYTGSKFPKTYDLEIRFYPQSSMYWMRYYVSANLTVSFLAPDTTQQNYLFVGAIGAFVIVMVVVLVIVMRGPGKGKK
jgi:hypothetical protein